MTPLLHPAPRQRLAPAVFRLLRDVVNAYSGLHFGDDDLPVFERRLSGRMAVLELESFAEYYKYLRLSPRGREELEEVVDLLTTKETYFFRQDYQLRAFSEELLPSLAAAYHAERRLSIWSAGCSTGEEAYTLAILVHESGLFDGWDVRIIGSDISRRNVSAARRGIYQAASFRVMSEARMRSYFAESDAGLQVVDSIRRLCHFGRVNLLEEGSAAIVGVTNAVFCRNVLIYFDLRSRRRVIDNLYDRLAPDGYLLLGHSESLLNVSTAFELVHLKEDLVYRKPWVTERWEGRS
jgi:chemotaxis protein methyltransferase CheR